MLATVKALYGIARDHHHTVEGIVRGGQIG